MNQQPMPYSNGPQEMPNPNERPCCGLCQIPIPLYHLAAGKGVLGGNAFICEDCADSAEGWDYVEGIAKQFVSPVEDAAIKFAQTLYDGVGIADALIVLIDLVKVDTSKPIGGFAGNILKEIANASQEREVQEGGVIEHPEAASRGISTEAGGGDRHEQGRQITEEETQTLIEILNELDAMPCRAGLADAAPCLTPEQTGTASGYRCEHHRLVFLGRRAIERFHTRMEMMWDKFFQGEHEIVMGVEMVKAMDQLAVAILQCFADGKLHGEIYETLVRWADARFGENGIERLKRFADLMDDPTLPTNPPQGRNRDPGAEPCGYCGAKVGEGCYDRSGRYIKNVHVVLGG